MSRSLITPSPRVDPGTVEVYIARQPILDSTGRVIGYELLFRGNATDQEFHGNPDQATASVIADVMSVFDLDAITHGQLAFINVTRGMLVGGLPSSLPPNRIVLEILEDMVADKEVMDACCALKRAGYRVALDDFTPKPDNVALLPFADFVKCGAAPSSAEWVEEVRRGAPAAALIAERIETPEALAEARALGFTHFQGFFFGRPSTQRATAIPEHQLDYLRLMDALRDPNLTNDQLEALIKPHASLCYRMLRTVNSAGFGLRTEVGSIGEALLLLGREPIQRWVSIWALASLSRGAHSELLVMSMMRARFCELLAAAGSNGTHAAGGFLLGMCSMLDVVFGKPMKEIVDHLPLGAPLRAALLGETNEWRRLLDCVIAYERAEWTLSSRMALEMGVRSRSLTASHADALNWALEACRFGETDQAA